MNASNPPQNKKNSQLYRYIGCFLRILTSWISSPQKEFPLSVTVCNLFSSSPARKEWHFSHFGKLTFLISSSHSILCSDTILIRFAPLSPLHSMRSIQLRNKLSYFLRFGKWFVRLLRFILRFCNAWT